jgi:actinin alpha 1/4
MKPWLENRITDNTLPGTQQKLSEFRDYRRVQKPPRLEQKAKLETDFNTLQTKLRLSNRPAYIPSEGKLVSDIANAWKGLEFSERGFEEWLLSELMRLERLDHLAKKFKHKCDIHEAWANGKDALLEQQDFKRCKLNDLRAMIKKHEAFESDLAAHQDRVEQIAAIAQELNTLGYHDVVSVNQRCEQICKNWDILGSLTSKRRNALNEADRVLEHVDSLFLEYAKRAAPYNNWIDGAREDLVDMFIVHSIDEIQGLINAHEQFKATLPEADREFNSIIALAKEAQNLCQQSGFPFIENPYTTIQAEELELKWFEVQGLVPQRDQTLQKEAIKQQNNEKLRMIFGQKANQIGPWIERSHDTIAQVTLNTQGLGQQLQKLKTIEQSLAQYKPSIDELENINKDIQEAMIFENRHTAYTMETIRIGWEQLGVAVTRNINEVENQV